MTDEFKVVDTTDLQMTSLVDFMAAIGYEAVFTQDGKLVRFKQPKFRKNGQEYIGVKRAIYMHNYLPDQVWRHTATVNTDFTTFLASPGGEDMINILFAGSTRIVERVKGQYSRKKGFFVHPSNSNMLIKFNTPKDEAQYGHHVRQEG